MTLNKLPKNQKLHIALGAFDGLHLAHAEVINAAVFSAQKEGGQSLILSFEPLPKEHFLDTVYPGRLLPPTVKKCLLKKYGADHICIEDFKTVHNLSEYAFFEKLFLKAEELHFYAGPDFHVGRAGSEPYTGDKAFIHSLPLKTIEGRPCRSTEIRKLIREGLLPEAAALLGREYIYYSHSIKGNSIGRTIDFPTINLAPTNQVVPQNGVYFGELCVLGAVYPAAVYVGTRPTLKGNEVRIEAHSIASFPHGDLPLGTPLCLRFIKKIFEEKAFESLAKLQEMLYNYKKVSSALAAERYKNHPAPPCEGLQK